MEKFIKNTCYIYEMSHYVIIMAYMYLCVAPGRVNLIYYIGLIFFYLVMFLVYKDYTKSKTRTFTLCRMGVVSFSISVPHYLTLLVEEKLKLNVINAIDIMLGLIILMVMMYLLFSDNAKKQEFVDKINVQWLFRGEKKQESNYDIVLCKDKDTGKDVILEADSRYVHFICIGPTGCGKSSQILNPMILQDIMHGNSVIVIEPKGDLAEKAYAMGVKYKRDVLYFNPIDPDCPRFNPLHGKEDEVIENLTTVFIMLSPDSATYFKDISDNLVRRSVMVLKRIEEAYRDPVTGISSRTASLVTLSDILHNTENRGRQYMNDLLAIPCLTASEEKQNKDTVDWFLNEYYADRSKVYENASGIRQQVSKLIQNKYLRRILNPENGVNDVDFDKILAEGKSISISTCQGILRELGSYLGYFLIFSLQSAIFRRPGNEFTRNPSFLYMDECQKYLVPGMSDLFAQARSYRVGMILATQSRESIIMESGKQGRSFLEVVTSNARNVVAFPGVSLEDAKFFSLSFGDEKKIQERFGESKQKASLFGDARPPMESVQRAEVIESKYTHADIVYKPFSEITYKIIKGKSVQMARDGVASFIPRDIDEELNQIASEYNLGQQEKSQKAEQYEQEQRRKMYESFQNSLKGGVSIGNINEFRRTPTEIKRENNVNISNRKFVAPKIQERQEDFVIKSVVGGKSENKNKQSPNKVIDEEVKDEYSPTEFDMPEEFDVNIN